ADHCSRIERMSLILGNVMNLSSAQLHTLKYAAFFHDIGTIRIPDHILNKPSSLTPEEWDTMKLHTIYGRQILAETGISSLVKASAIVEQHHERYDGQGYPHGLKGKEIDPLASIVSVVDSFDAMTYDRIYRKAKPKQEAIDEIVRCRGTMYDPDTVDAFLTIIDQI
ncbi:MAG: HD-GYP domain-containing protein, partial [Tumebacillaceae bacterium]